MVSKLEGQVEGESLRQYQGSESAADCGSTEQRLQVDDSVGTLVWVRRRNGHWWPGRVLAAHELPQSILLFPKSGKPVRLLGKDDANVDWYNIEKSRRIKAFRCGEFDKIIERAKSCAANLKKREKYARREEAILHALSLEKLQAEGRQTLGVEAGVAWACTGGNKLRSHEAPKHDKIRSICYVDYVNTPHRIPKAPPLTSGSNGVLASMRTTNLNGEEDVLESIPRMRDLQDFGLHLTRCQGRKNICKNVSDTQANRNVAVVPFPEDQSKVESCVSRISTAARSAPSMAKVSAAAIGVQKRKKHPAGSSTDESHYRKRERRKSLTDVLKKSSRKLAVYDGNFINKASVYDANFINIQTPMRLNGATEATPPSEEKLQQTANEPRPCSESKGLELPQSISYGETHGILAASRKASSSFLFPCLDASRWPLSLGAPLDFGLLLGSAYADSTFERTPASLCSGMAYAGSATSGNISGSREYLCEEALNLSSCVGHHKGNNARGQGKDLQSSEAGDVCLPTGPEVSMWQAKRRRNVRRPLRSMTEIQSENVNACKDDQCQVSCGVLHSGCKKRGHASINIRPRNTILFEGGPITRNIGLESTSLKLCEVSMRSDSTLLDGTRSCTQRLGFCWVDVSLEFRSSKAERIQLVSLFSEVMNRAVSGYSVSVGILERGWQCNSTSARVSCNRTNAKASAKLVVPQNASQAAQLCRTTKYCNQRHVSTTHMPKKVVLKGQRSSSKRGSIMLRKTRTLSSLAIHDREFPAVHYNPEYQKKRACMSCIPVHIVFDRIREVLYKQSNGTPDRIRETVSEK